MQGLWLAEAGIPLPEHWRPRLGGEWRPAPTPPHTSLNSWSLMLSSSWCGSQRPWGASRFYNCLAMGSEQDGRPMWDWIRVCECRGTPVCMSQLQSQFFPEALEHQPSPGVPGGSPLPHPSFRVLACLWVPAEACPSMPPRNWALCWLDLCQPAMFYSYPKEASVEKMLL